MRKVDTGFGDQDPRQSHDDDVCQPSQIRDIQPVRNPPEVARYEATGIHWTKVRPMGGFEMELASVTWPQALKIWWSYSWRAFVLVLLIMIPLEAVMFWYMMSHFPKPGTNATPETAARMAGMMAVVWPIAMAVMIALQVQAMRWMLKSARWSDFRVAVLSRDQ